MLIMMEACYYFGDSRLFTEGTEKGRFSPFLVPSKQCAEPLQYFKKPSMSGFLIEGAQRAAPLLLNLVTEKGRFSPFLVSSFLHVVGVRTEKDVLFGQNPIQFGQ
jgi:hypothetical protein